MKDLAIVVADANMDSTLRGLLEQQRPSLGIRQIEFEIEPHPGHDGGVRVTGPSALARFHRNFRHGIIMLDWEGSGSDHPTVLELESDLDSRLRLTWGDRAKSIVIEPEVDAWVWGNDNLMKDVLNWQGDQSIRDWLRARGFEFTAQGKPGRPKEALFALMKELRRPRSSSVYKTLASRIGLRRCTDPAFDRLRAALRAWFGA